MADRKRSKKEKPDTEREPDQPHQPRPFWSGVIAFGLVSLPVSLFSANRGKSISLNIVDEDGNRLRRRFFCEKDAKALEREDIVRGYPLDNDQFVIVEDEELEALAPDKTREIDLRRFVPLEEINPVFFERGYFLAPNSDTTKAYRLLAKSLEDEQRAGIATFVMRDREYLVAIMSSRGILRAETLRFHDEIRSPQQVGLPEKLPSPDKPLLQKMQRAIKARSHDELDRELLTEQQVKDLRKLVSRKLAKHEDILDQEEEEPSREHEEDDSNVIDLMQLLKERLRGQTGQRGEGKPGKPGKKQKQSRPSRADIERLSRDELYKQAQKKAIPGRSKMTKDQLANALKQAG